MHPAYRKVNIGDPYTGRIRGFFALLAVSLLTIGTGSLKAPTATERMKLELIIMKYVS